jgi:uncharacterized protein
VEIPHNLAPKGLRRRPTARRRFTLLAFLFTWAFVHAAEVIPPPPADHFNDYAGLVRRETAAQLERELTQFERDTSNQILVVIYPRMQSASSVEDYTVRVAERWRVGQQARNNGAVLFVFQQSRDIRIVTGYGLEGALPDALCKQIIEDEMIPRFRAGDFDGGLVAGVRAMMAATRGEYTGRGRTAADARRRSDPGGGGLFTLFIIALIIISALRGASHRKTVYGRRGRRTVWIDPGGWRGGGGGFGGGSFGGGGGGSFSGGGGSFGGGGAGGRW